MDRPNTPSPRDLFAGLGMASAPLVFDVRRIAAFDVDIRMTPLA
jgi:hypothetical protein